MAGGWTNDGAVQDQIEDSVADAVERARSQLGNGAGRSHCEECGEAIPEGRRRAVPGARCCIACQAERDARSGGAAGLNRRASKDALLR
jgi:phage/conjugal plasmid C-4 type zinc finger TraR family protein